MLIDEQPINCPDAGEPNYNVDIPTIRNIVGPRGPYGLRAPDGPVWRMRHANRLFLDADGAASSLFPTFQGALQAAWGGVNGSKCDL